MKVNQNLRLHTEPVHNETKVKIQGNTNFHELVKNQNEKLQMGQLQGLYLEIEKASERLKNHVTSVI